MSHQSRDNCDIMMTIMRRLINTEDVDARNQMKRDLKKSFIKYDAILDDLIEDYTNDLFQTIKTISTLESKLSLARQKIVKLRESLQACYQSFSINMAPIRALWEEIQVERFTLDKLEEREQDYSMQDKDALT